MSSSANRLRRDNTNYQGFVTFAAYVKRAVEKCGGTFASERTYPQVLDLVSANNAEAATQNMAAFKAANVTTIIWPQGFDVQHARAGARLDYRPEWVLAGDRAFDRHASTSYQDSSAWSYSWVVSPEVLQADVQQDRCAQALREADPAFPDQDIENVCYASWYQDLRQFFTGVQVAGPRLNPDSLDKGMHAIPSVLSNDPRVPACYYEPNDYTCVKDAVAMWWDPSQQAPGGCYRMPDGGVRYTAGRWPPGDVLAQKGRDDPCNGYPGGSYTAGGA